MDQEQKKQLKAILKSNDNMDFESKQKLIEGLLTGNADFFVRNGVLHRVVK